MNEFNHLVRFENEEGHIFIGDITEDVSHLESLVGVEAEVFEGTSPWDSGFRKVGHKQRIYRVRLPSWVFGIPLTHVAGSRSAPVCADFSLRWAELPAPRSGSERVFTRKHKITVTDTLGTGRYTFDSSLVLQATRCTRRLFFVPWICRR